MKRDNIMERLLTGEKVKEQLTFKNLLPEEKKTPEIIPIRADGLQPRKLEDVLPDSDILRDTYIIYPDGGYHPFYGVPNTLPIYQQKIWPFVKRIKFSEHYFSSKEQLDKARRSGVRKNHDISQANPFFDGLYPFLTLYRIATRRRYKYTTKKGKESYTTDHKTKKALFHRLSALAFIPNPEKKPYVLHINDNSADYTLKNLKWGTGSENQRGSRGRAPDTMEQKYLDLVNKGVIKG